MRRARLTLDIDPELHAQIKLVRQEGTPMRDYAVDAIEQRLAEEPAQYLRPGVIRCWLNFGTTMTMRSTTSFSRGDIVLVPFQFSDKPIFKNRPCHQW